MKFIEEINIYIKAHRLANIIMRINRLSNSEKFVITMKLLNDLNMKADWNKED